MLLSAIYLPEKNREMHPHRVQRVHPTGCNFFTQKSSGCTRAVSK